MPSVPPGESFSFTGDDDVWVFINDILAVDIGGKHSPETASVDLDAAATKLGITKTQYYTLKMFHAERQETGSNFKATTSIKITCVRGTWDPVNKKCVCPAATAEYVPNV